MKRCKQQQILIRQLLQRTAVFVNAQLEVQRTVSLVNLHIAHVAAQHRRNIPVSGGNDFAHRPTAGEHRIQILVHKVLQAPLSPAHGNGVHKPLQLRLGPAAPAGNGEPAAQSDNLDHCRVNHRNGLSHRAIHPHVAAQTGIAVQRAKGMGCVPPQLYRRRIFALRSFE